jgi:hypothetical protein
MTANGILVARPAAPAAASAMPGFGQSLSKTSAGTMATVPSCRARTSPIRSAIRPPRNGRRDEQGGGAKAEGDERGRGQHRGQEEPGAAARGEDAHRRRAAAAPARADLPAAGWNIATRAVGAGSEP